MKNAALPIFLSFCLVIPMMRDVNAAATNAAPAASPPDHTDVNRSSTMTPEEWQELRTARQAALKANPNFTAKYGQLSAKMRAFQDKLDAAMIKADPGLAPIVAKFEGKRDVNHSSSASLQNH